MEKTIESEKKEENKKEKKTLKRVGNILFYVLLGLFFLLACFSLTTRITKGRIFHSQFLVVISGSMDGERQEEYDIKTIPLKSLVKVSLIEEGKENEFYSSLKKGDILTFNYLALNNATITHRIISDPVVLDDGTIKYELKGDAVEGNEIQTLYSDGRSGEILGKVTFVSLPLGQMYFFISSKVGTLCLVVLPSTAIVLFEICKIIFMVSENSKKKSEEKNRKEKEEKDKEIEELKRQLEESKKDKECQ